ncbi:MAG: hypothetical protein AAFR76_01820 [Planctomycetota bacterium]
MTTYSIRTKDKSFCTSCLERLSAIRKGNGFEGTAMLFPMLISLAGTVVPRPSHLKVFQAAVEVCDLNTCDADSFAAVLNSNPASNPQEQWIVDVLCSCAPTTPSFSISLVDSTLVLLNDADLVQKHESAISDYTSDWGARLKLPRPCGWSVLQSVVSGSQCLAALNDNSESISAAVGILTWARHGRSTSMTFGSDPPLPSIQLDDFATCRPLGSSSCELSAADVLFFERTVQISALGWDNRDAAHELTPSHAKRIEDVCQFLTDTSIDKRLRLAAQRAFALYDEVRATRFRRKRLLHWWQILETVSACISPSGDTSKVAAICAAVIAPTADFDVASRFLVEVARHRNDIVHRGIDTKIDAASQIDESLQRFVSTMMHNFLVLGRKLGSIQAFEEFVRHRAASSHKRNSIRTALHFIENELH